MVFFENESVKGETIGKINVNRILREKFGELLSIIRGHNDDNLSVVIFFKCSDSKSFVLRPVTSRR